MATLSNTFIEGVYRAIANEGMDRSIPEIEEYLSRSASFINPSFKREWDEYSPEERRTNIQSALKNLRFEGKVEEVEGSKYRARD